MLENNTFRIMMFVVGAFALGGIFYYFAQHYEGFKEIMDQFSSYRLKKY